MLRRHRLQCIRLAHWRTRTLPQPLPAARGYKVWRSATAKCCFNRILRQERRNSIGCRCMTKPSKSVAQRQVHPAASALLILLVFAAVQFVWWRFLVYKPPPGAGAGAQAAAARPKWRFTYLAGRTSLFGPSQETRSQVRKMARHTLLDLTARPDWRSSQRNFCTLRTPAIIASGRSSARRYVDVRRRRARLRRRSYRTGKVQRTLWICLDPSARFM